MDYKKIVEDVIKNWSIFADSLTFLQNNNRDSITFNDFVGVQNYIMTKHGVYTAKQNDAFWDEFKKHTSTNHALNNIVRVVMQVMYDWWFIVEGVSDFCPPDFDRNLITYKEFVAVQDYIEKEKGINTEAKREEFWATFKKLTANSVYI